MRTRLRDDVGFFIQASIARATETGDKTKAPFWALARTMFPIAESLAFLLFGGVLEKETSKRLSRFIHDELGAKNPNYQPLASVICQVWRHGLTHCDEPPVLIVDAPVIDGANGVYDLSNARSISWKLALGNPSDHLKVVKVGNQSAQFTFCLLSFFQDLYAVVDDDNRWAGFAPSEISNRYNEWTSKFLDGSSPNSEKGKAAAEIRKLLP